MGEAWQIGVGCVTNLSRRRLEDAIIYSRDTYYYEHGSNQNSSFLSVFLSLFPFRRDVTINTDLIRRPTSMYHTLEHVTGRIIQGEHTTIYSVFESNCVKMP
jgi:hypothetical protein